VRYSGDRNRKVDMKRRGLGGEAMLRERTNKICDLLAPRGQWKARHGVLCAASMAVDVAAMRARAPHHPALERYSAIARLLTRRTEASVEYGIDWVRAPSAEPNIPTLRARGSYRG
jgi:hypothetical protein